MAVELGVQRVSDYTSITFRAEIKLSAEEIADAGGDVRQAVQTEVTHTGAVVLEVEEGA